MQTQVGIIGGGPAGLLLSHLLALEGIESIVLEQRSRQELESIVRAAVLEQGSVDLLKAIGAGERLMREGTVHHGIELRYLAQSHRVPLSELTGGRAITLYPQHELVKDLITLRLAAGGEVRFEARAVRIFDATVPTPVIAFEEHGNTHEIRCDFIVGCEGYSSLARQAFPQAQRREYQRQYPFGWLGILVEARRIAPELIYARHAQGFALVSTRSATLQRLYLQCEPQDTVADWPDARIWEALEVRLEAPLGAQPARGAIVEKDVVAMRSFVCEPMQFGRIFLAGDAAHIVPPTGAKGMNLAIADVRTLSAALVNHYQGDAQDLTRYSATCLKRVWRAQRFSSWMTSLLHRFPDADEFRQRLQLVELEAIADSPIAARLLAERYV
ncbi:MAG: 4-hydroxybenzoate 3-monooxygenase, partial [Gammaproteobacteria bacterium]